ncbi:hypothetical protein CLV30_11058 [Haloactinopolyspora alba]|uniref:Tetracycline repressor-like protein n=1 Tax=Haloactinopolyspora alba TaxID=648780 RepID=A0A2P8DYV8_9ACTN|nr:hypothetical protein [Haloactinopolyspora alba]PSL02405.1 hypothetical protein CLV30_11058 [Haloactinopolyspora alba]
MGPALVQAMNGRRFPLAERVGVAAGQEHAAGDPRAGLDLGLELVIDGLERRPSA